MGGSRRLDWGEGWSVEREVPLPTGEVWLGRVLGPSLQLNCYHSKLRGKIQFAQSEGLKISYLSICLFTRTFVTGAFRTETEGWIRGSGRQSPGRLKGRESANDIRWATTKLNVAWNLTGCIKVQQMLNGIVNTNSCVVTGNKNKEFF